MAVAAAAAAAEGRATAVAAVTAAAAARAASALSAAHIARASPVVIGLRTPGQNYYRMHYLEADLHYVPGVELQACINGLSQYRPLSAALSVQYRLSSL